ncbi:MAG: hypothetical protein ACJ8IQ_11720 [Chthoniobacterales bacterium]
MNDFSELESDLKKLRPQSIRPELMAQVERALEQPQTQTAAAGVTKRRSISWNWLPLGLGLAAAATFLLLARVNVDRAPNPGATVAAVSPQPRTTVPSVAPQFVPAGLTQVVYNTRDEGLYFPRGANTPVRRTRSMKRETVKFHNPQTGASLQVSYPAEEVTLVPISAQ